MRIRNVLLIVCHTTTNETLKLIGSETLIDRRIRELRDLDKNPIVVIGQNGDELLLNSKLLCDCDMVFTSNTDLESGITDGLEGAGPNVFVLPIEQSVPAYSEWQLLEKILFTAIPLPEGIRLKNQDYPLLLTSRGTQKLRTSHTKHALAELRVEPPSPSLDKTC